MRDESGLQSPRQPKSALLPPPPPTVANSSALCEAGRASQPQAQNCHHQPEFRHGPLTFGLHPLVRLWERRPCLFPPRERPYLLLWPRRRTSTQWPLQSQVDLRPTSALVASLLLTRNDRLASATWPCRARRLPPDQPAATPRAARPTDPADQLRSPKRGSVRQAVLCLSGGDTTWPRANKYRCADQSRGPGFARGARSSVCSQRCSRTWSQPTWDRLSLWPNQNRAESPGHARSILSSAA